MTKFKLTWKSIHLLIVLVIGFYGINYAIPDIPILGRFAIGLSIFLIGIKNPVYGILAGFTIAGALFLSRVREGFEWPDDTRDDFIRVQSNLHPRMSFDTDVIKKQASSEEVDYFLQYAEWPWSKEVQDLYKAAVLTNPFIRADPEGSMSKARKIYNQSIVLEMMSWQTKEGQFLLNGVVLNDSSGNPQGEFPSGFGEYGYNSGLTDKMNDVIRCGVDASGNSYMIKINGIDGKEESIDYDQLDSTIPGFSFIREKCDPCVALNDPPNYSCPFKLAIPGKRNGVSAVWQYLWGINTNPSRLTPSSIPDISNSTEFPLLSGLKQELNTLQGQ